MQLVWKANIVNIKWKRKLKRQVPLVYSLIFTIIYKHFSELVIAKGQNYFSDLEKEACWYKPKGNSEGN